MFGLRLHHIVFWLALCMIVFSINKKSYYAVWWFELFKKDNCIFSKLLCEENCPFTHKIDSPLTTVKTALIFFGKPGRN